MSFNVGGLYVLSKKGVDVAAVAKAITACWVSRGAKPDPKGEPLALKPLGLAKTKKLGYALVDVADWIVVAESERYTFDHGVARHVAKQLGTTCVWYVLCGATDAGIAIEIGKKDKRVDGYGEAQQVVEELPLAFTYYDKLDGDDDDMMLVALTAVPHDKYDTGPVASADDAPQEPPAKAPRLSASTVCAPHEPVRIRHEKHGLLLRDAFTLAWFLDGKVEKPIADALDRYLSLIPKDMIRWALLGSNSTSVRPFAKPLVARAKTMMKKQDSYLWLGSDEEPETGVASTREPHAPAYMFLVHRRGGGENPALLEMRFASDFVWQYGVDAMVDFAIEITKTLPVVSGNGGLQLVGHPMVTSYSSDADAAIPAIAEAHPGYDAADNDAMEMGTRIRGAHWLTILGPKLAKQMSAALAQTGAELVKAGKSLVVRAGAEPEPDPDPALIGKVARALLPVTWLGNRFFAATFRDRNTGEGDPIAFAAWEFRFMGGLEGALAYLAAQPDPASLVRVLAIRLAQHRYADAQAALAAAEKAGAQDQDLGRPILALSKLAEEDKRSDEAVAWMKRFVDRGGPKRSDTETRFALWASSELYKRLGMTKEADETEARLKALTEKMFGPRR